MKIETPRKETLGPVGTVLHPNDLLPPDRPGTRLGKNKGAEKSSSLGGHIPPRKHTSQLI